MNKLAQQIFAADAEMILGNAGEFSRELIYTPRDDAEPRRITGLVNVLDSTEWPGMTHGRSKVIRITVQNHGTKGILASEIDTGDQLTVCKFDGVNDEVRTISTKDSNGQSLVITGKNVVRIVLV